MQRVISQPKRSRMRNSITSTQNNNEFAASAGCGDALSQLYGIIRTAVVLLPPSPSPSPSPSSPSPSPHAIYTQMYSFTNKLIISLYCNSNCFRAVSHKQNILDRAMHTQRSTKQNAAILVIIIVIILLLLLLSLLLKHEHAHFLHFHSCHILYVVR